MDFWFTIVIIGFEFVSLMVYILYFIADYAHPEDTDFGRSIFTRVMIFLGFLAAYSSMLMVQLDVLISKDSTAAKHAFVSTFWVVVILIQIIFVFIAAPLMIVYYSSNENDPFLRRIFKSFRA